MTTRRGPVSWTSATILALPGILLGTALFLGQPTPFDAMVGQCPAPSADPLSVCYDPATAAAAHSGDGATILALEAGHDCVPQGEPGRIPASVVLAAGGKIQRLGFDQAWRLVHGPTPTRVYAQCYR